MKRLAFALVLSIASPAALAATADGEAAELICSIHAKAAARIMFARQHGTPFGELLSIYKPKASGDALGRMLAESSTEAVHEAFDTKVSQDEVAREEQRLEFAITRLSLCQSRFKNGKYGSPIINALRKSAEKVKAQSK